MIKEANRNNQYAIYGRILRKEREDGCYIGSDITKRTGLSKQLISDIEIGNKNVSFEKIRIYASFFDIAFDRAVNRKGSKEVLKAFYEALDCLIYADIDGFVKIFQVVKKEKSEIIYSKSADVFYLFEMIYSLVIKDMTCFHANRNIINKYFFDILDAQLSFIYWLTLGYYYNMAGRCERALQIFRKIREAGTSISVDLQAMLYFGLGMSYRSLGNPLSSMTAYQKAKALFDESNNYIRSLYTSAYTGRNMMSMYRYDEAATLYDNLMKTALFLNDETLINELRLSIVENFFYKGDYLKVIELANQWMKECSCPENLCVLRMWAYYKSDNIQMCREALDSFMKNDEKHSCFHICISKCLQALLKQDDDRIIESLMELYEITEDKHLYDIQEFMLEILTSALNRQEKYYDAVKYYEYQIMILKKKMNDTEHFETEFNYSIPL